MTTFSQLFKESWGTVFRDKKTFFIVFGFLAGITMLMQISLFLMGYNIADQQSMNALFQDFRGLSVFIVFALLGAISAFFGIVGLVKMFKKKKITILDVLKEWKQIFPYISTMICGVLGYIVFVLTMMIIIGLGAGILFAGSITYPYLSSLPYNIGIVLGGTGFVIVTLGIILGIGVSIWLFSSLYAFMIPAFFLDDHKYFSTMSTSWNTIRGRWLRTAGFFFLYGVVMIIIFIIIGFIQSFINPMNIVSLAIILIQTSLQAIFGMFLYTFSFALYEDYKKHPLLKKKK